MSPPTNPVRFTKGSLIKLVLATIEGCYSQPRGDWYLRVAFAEILDMSDSRTGSSVRRENWRRSIIPTLRREI
jgi:hypothetical protein